MIKRNLLAVAAGFLLVGCGQSMSDLGGKSSPTLSDKDNAFFKTLAISDKTETSSSELALQQSSNPEVKKFATMMIADHKESTTKAMTLAQSKDVTLPQQVDSDHQKMVNDLRGKSGTDFDKSYVDMQVAAHKDTVAAVEDESMNGQDSAVKNLATSLLPTLREHLQMAQNLQSKMSGM